MHKKTCAICLILTENLEKINRENENWLETLKKIAPEITWSETYDICPVCIQEIKRIEKFHRICVENELKRQKSFNQPIPPEPITREEPIIAKEDPVKTFETTKKHSNHNSNNKEPIRNVKTDDGANPGENPRVPKRKRQIFRCPRCEFESKYTKPLIEHCIKAHDLEKVKPYSCDVCPMRFASSANVTQHRKYHAGARDHVCAFCGKSYITSSDLSKHETWHRRGRAFGCAACGKAFNSLANLSTHRVVVHAPRTSWRFECAACGRAFPMKSALDSHTLRHSGERVFACRVCPRAFVVRDDLRKHLRTHADLKAFACDVCGRGFARKAALLRHAEGAHEIGARKERKFACGVCPKTFYYKQGLGRHLVAHSRENQKKGKVGTGKSKRKTPLVIASDDRGDGNDESGVKLGEPISVSATTY